MSQKEPPGVAGERPLPKRPLSIGAGAVVIHERRVLLVRNIRGVTRGRYLLPAGRTDPDELPDQTAVREAFEETNLRVEIEGLLGVRLWVMDDGEHNYGLDPVEALQAANAVGARVHIIGVDLPAEVRIRPEVQRLARAVRQNGGRYLDAGTVSELRSASKSIDALEKGWLVQTRSIRNQPIYHYFALLALVLLTAAMVLRAIPYFIDVT